MQKVRILNFVLDEKFIDGLIATNKLIEEESHRYVVHKKNSEDKQLKFIKDTQHIEVLTSKEIRLLLESSDFDAVFLHSITSIPFSLYSSLPKIKPVFWFSWGYDIYQLTSRPLVPINIYHMETGNFMKASDQSKIHGVHGLKIIRRILGHIHMELRRKRDARKIRDAIRRIDYHSGVLDYETELIRKYNSEFKAQQVQFNYFDPRVSTDYTPVCGLNIQIGNSAASTNNHLDLLPYFEKFDSGDRKIIMPLSYAAPSEKYTEKVIKSYAQQFGDRYNPLVGFLPLEEYNKIMMSCAVAIYFIERQQAIGNLGHSFKCGQKVFLSETSMMYKYFKSKGFHVFSIQSELNEADSLKPLGEQERIYNYKLWKFYQDQWREHRDEIRERINSWNNVCR